jgi:hypothetical protein
VFILSFTWPAGIPAIMALNQTGFIGDDLVPIMLRE